MNPQSSSSRTRAITTTFGLAILLLVIAGCAGVPRINERFPLKTGEQLSPPFVMQPVHECAQVVHVFGFIPHARVEVYANHTELIGTATPDFGFADITVSRALNLGEIVTATQTINGMTSVQSYQPAVVSAYSDGFKKPDVGKDLYDCGVIVPVGNLVESVRVHVSADGTEVGQADTATQWVPVWVLPLKAGQDITAVQRACEENATKLIESPISDAVKVQPAPNPVPSPIVRASSLIPGNDTVTLDGLFVGAGLNVSDNGAQIGGGFATASANLVPVAPPLTSASKVSAVQSLCGVDSPPSPPTSPAGELTAPVVVGPICEGAQYVIIRNSIVNANVVLFRNGSIVGYGGAVPGDLILSVGGNATLHLGDVITAEQYMGTTISPRSNPVTVAGRLGQPFVEVNGGEPFFIAEAGEQQIDAAVFPRGKGRGPQITVQACCNEGVKAQIHTPDGQIVADVDMVQLFPGYYTGFWDWQSGSGWNVPSEIPVGPYQVTVSSGCNEKPAKKGFYVIFNPEDVAGPARFSFDETGIWFGTLPNSTRAVLYHLHPDDARVFKIAMGAAKGQTSSLEAAKKIAEAEESLFGYSLDYHGDDVLHMLTDEDEAQCADDANVLTALLRSVGIPAHPTTADAALETKDAGWTFDTWTEFLPALGTEWLIIHPHEFPGMDPETRQVFGSTRGVAVKSFNDLIVMANENWVWNEASDGQIDVSFTRNECLEPSQQVNKKSWVTELCEQGYWTPNHWDCIGVSSRGFGLAIESRLNITNIVLGRPIVGKLILSNQLKWPISGEFTTELVTDLPESMRFPDRILTGRVTRVSLAPGSNDVVLVDFSMPRTLPAGHQLYLRGLIGGTNVFLAPISIQSAIRAKVEMPQNLRAGSVFTIRATIINSSDMPIRGVRASLTAPSAISLRSRTTPPPELPAGGRAVLVWSARVLAPIEAGTVRLDVDTDDGGSARIDTPVTAPGESRVTAAPSIRLPRRK